MTAQKQATATLKLIEKYMKIRHTWVKICLVK